MKRFAFAFLLVFVFYMLCGCEQQPAYRLYENRKFVLESSGVYRNGEDYVYVNGNIITMSFSDASIIVNGIHYRIIYEDECYWDCKPGGCSSGIMLFDHDHDATVASLTKEYNSGQSQDGSSENKDFVTALIISIGGTFVTGLFVFKPSYIRRMAIWGNSIIPMYKEPYEPSDLYVGMHYFGLLIGFMAFLIYIIIMIASLF